MKHISDLYDIGKDKKCLIVGGGDSLNRFQWDMLDDTYVICCNQHLSQMANMIVYYDKDMMEHFTKHEISEDTYLIGFRKEKGHRLDYTCPQCTHYYNYQDMIFGDTGFHVVQFADRIFNFDEIYLVGLDYATNGKSYHHDEEESDPEALDKFRRWSIDIVLGRYKNIQWKHRIYNCSNESALEMFEYGLPY